MNRSLHQQIESKIRQEGKHIHALIENSFDSAGISEASPAWQDYIGNINDVILNGLKNSSLKSLGTLYRLMTDENDLKTPFISLNLELIENKLNFNPPLDEKTNFKNLKETIFEWISMFIMRGSLVSIVGQGEVGIRNRCFVKIP